VVASFGWETPIAPGENLFSIAALSCPVICRA
jgi:hypothetical protein